MAKRSAISKKLLEEEPLIIKDASALKALAEPTRLQILLELGAGTAKTVKDVATALDLNATRLYYHFKILEKAGLIRVSARRMISGIEERSYAATATSWTPAPEPGSALAESGIIDALLEVVRAEVELALGSRSEAPLGETDSPVPVMSFTRLALDEGDVEEVRRRIEAIMIEYGELGPAPAGKRLYHALFSAYQAPSELRERSQAAGATSRTEEER
jgi:DNA-binding transcriptional ArsR family regulator